MKTMHLFAGGGGGMYADLILGHTPTVAVEWEKAACDVLRARKEEWWPDCEIVEGDIRAFSGVRYAGEVDCIHAGFPCPTFSHAGKGAGLEDDRGTLYREALRVFDEVRPDYLFLENVPGILTAQDGYAFARIMADLAEIGFDSIRWDCLSAAEVGANHRRNRWWCLAQKHGSESNAPHTDADGTRPHRAEKYQYGSAELRDKQKCESRSMGEKLADPQSQRCGEEGPSFERSEEWTAGAGAIQGPNDSRGGQAGPWDMANPESQRYNEGRLPKRTGAKVTDAEVSCEHVANANGLRFEGERGSGQKGTAEHGEGRATGWWSTEPPLGRVANGVANRVNRLKMLGNGQVPLQAAFAWVMLGGPHNSGGI